MTTPREPLTSRIAGAWSAISLVWSMTCAPTRHSTTLPTRASVVKKASARNRRRASAGFGCCGRTSTSSAAWYRNVLAPNPALPLPLRSHSNVIPGHLESWSWLRSRTRRRVA